MKKLISAALSLITALSAASFAYAAENEPITCELEAMAGISAYKAGNSNEQNKPSTQNWVGGTTKKLNDSIYTNAVTGDRQDVKAVIGRFNLSALSDESNYTYELGLSNISLSSTQNASRTGNISIYIAVADTKTTIKESTNELQYTPIGDEWTNESKNIVCWNNRPRVSSGFTDAITLTNPANDGPTRVEFDVTDIINNANISSDKLTLVVLGCAESYERPVSGGEVVIGDITLTATPVEEAPEEPTTTEMTAVNFDGTTPEGMNISDDNLTITSTDGDSASAWRGRFTNENETAASAVTVTATTDSETKSATFSGTTISGENTEVVFYVLIDRAADALESVTFEIN